MLNFRGVLVHSYMDDLLNGRYVELLGWIHAARELCDRKFRNSVWVSQKISCEIIWFIWGFPTAWTTCLLGCWKEMMVTNRCSMLLTGHQKNLLHFQGGLASHYYYTSEHCRLNIVRNLWFFQIPLLPYHRHLWRLWMQMACVVVIQLGSSMRWSSWILIRRWVDRLLRVQYGAVTMENPQWRRISYWTWEFFQRHVSFEGGYTDRSFRVQMVQKNSYSIIPSKHIESTLGPKLS